MSIMGGGKMNAVQTVLLCYSYKIIQLRETSKCLTWLHPKYYIVHMLLKITTYSWEILHLVVIFILLDRKNCV